MSVRRVWILTTIVSLHAAFLANPAAGDEKSPPTLPDLRPAEIQLKERFTDIEREIARLRAANKAQDADKLAKQLREFADALDEGQRGGKKKKGKYRLRDYAERGEDEKLGLPQESGEPAPLVDTEEPPPDAPFPPPQLAERRTGRTPPATSTSTNENPRRRISSSGASATKSPRRLSRESAMLWAICPPRIRA